MESLVSSLTVKEGHQKKNFLPQVLMNFSMSSRSNKSRQ